MIRAYHQPEVLEEALGLIAQGAVPIAGATGLYVGKTRRDTPLVDVTRIGLNTIVVDKTQLVFGATVTMTQLAQAAELPGMEGALLRRAAGTLASRPLRNMITLGGNIAHTVYWADLPVVLLALDASVEVQHTGEAPKLVPFSDCVLPGKRSWAGGLITRVIVPRRQGTLGFGHERLTRTVTDYSLVTVCATLRYEKGLAHDVRLVVGAVLSRPTRIFSVESLLEGKAPDPPLLDEAVQKVLGEVVPAPNYRAPTEYRKEMAGVLTRRVLNTALNWASRESGENG